MPELRTPVTERMTGADNPPPPRHQLDARNATRLAEIAGSLCTRGRLDDPAWLGRLRTAATGLPEEIRGLLSGFVYDSGPAGAMVVSGVVTDPGLPPTPTVFGSTQRVPTLSSAALLLLSQCLGHPVAYREEKSGALVQDVVPVRGRETDQSNAGTVELLMHTENAFHPYRPDCVLLLCVRADPANQAGLRVASVRRAMPLLDERTTEILCQPRFRTSQPPSFGGAVETQLGPVLRGAPEDPDLCVDFAATKAVDPVAAEALDAFSRAMRAVTHELALRAGDLAIVDNRVAAHGRTSYLPRYDGTDRWLHRTYVRVDFRSSRHLRPDNGHVLDSRH